METIICNKNLDFEYEGKDYNLYHLPENVVLDANLKILGLGLSHLPNLSSLTINGFFDMSRNMITSLDGFRMLSAVSSVLLIISWYHSGLYLRTSVVAFIVLIMN